MNKQMVQCFGRKKNSVAVALCRQGQGIVKVNGCPIQNMEPQALLLKATEPLLILGKEKIGKIDIKIRVNGGGRIAQAYAIRQAIARGVISYYQKYVDEQKKRDIKDILLKYDRSLLVSDPRRCEPKKFGGPGARSRQQKSYR